MVGIRFKNDVKMNKFKEFRLDINLWCGIVKESDIPKLLKISPYSELKKMKMYNLKDADPDMPKFAFLNYYNGMLFSEWVVKNDMEEYFKD